MSQDKVHVMIDLETLDTASTATILSIGACTIVDVAIDNQNTFYRELDPKLQFATRTVSLQTQAWWEEQEQMKGIRRPGQDGIRLSDSLDALSFWLKTLRAEPIIWCKGLDFDVAILNSAYRQLTIPIPWKYNNVRDCRTLFKLFGIKSEPELTAHHALRDATDQATKLLRIAHYFPGGLQ